MLQPPLAIKSKGTAKDVAKLERGTVNGDVNFPAFLIQNKHIQEELQKFDIYLLEDIMDYPKHIPYTSEKKGFQLQTGRDSFECTLQLHSALPMVTDQFRSVPVQIQI